MSQPASDNKDLGIFLKIVQKTEPKFFANPDDELCVTAWNLLLREAENSHKAIRNLMKGQAIEIVCNDETVIPPASSEIDFSLGGDGIVDYEKHFIEEALKYTNRVNGSDIHLKDIYTKAKIEFKGKLLSTSTFLKNCLEHYHSKSGEEPAERYTPEIPDFVAKHLNNAFARIAERGYCGMSIENTSIVIDTKPEAFIKLAHYGVDNGSCFGTERRNNKLRLMTVEGSFVAIMKVKDVVKARCFGIMNNDGVFLSNCYPKNTGQNITIMATLISEFFYPGKNHDVSKVVMSGDGSKIPIYFNGDAVGVGKIASNKSTRVDYGHADKDAEICRSANVIGGI